ncbi:MAG: glycine cleavage system aminomethyltransferase GcvT, partial [Candidatus Aminicenantes bacterium]|nr:glycine cleavage system aminomethyltransferase GcvT [Candidatus Aminicenantes bacterium]
SALTTPQGTFIDDLLVYCLDLKRYMLVVNASNIEKDYNWILKNKNQFMVTVDNASDRISQLALQGPKAQEILQPLTDINLDQLRPFWWQQGKVAGLDCLVSRTGYTGEDGFEIYTEEPEPTIIWDAIMEEGKQYGLLPAGLGARDNLRLEAKMMLYGNDIDETTTVLEADLKWIIKFNKGDFIGREALIKQQEVGLRRKIVGFEIIEKGIARRHYPVFYQGEKVGEVTSGSYSPFLKKSIGLTYLPIEATQIGTEIEIGIREKRVKARVVSTPFYKRPK